MALSSTPTLSFFLISLLILTLSPASSLPPEASPSHFVDSVSQVLHALQPVVSLLSRFADFSGHSRLSHAISDCLDLLDSSSDYLSSSASASQSPHGKHNGTGNLNSDLRTWLSAALANPETCVEGFEGTNSIVRGLISSGLQQVSSLVQELLAQVHPVSDHSSGSNSRFPRWLKPGDRKLLQANGVPVDVVVAADGTGNYTKVMDAVLAAPDNSMKRYVIYVKRGVYFENVEIKKKKWNLMMIGDGMDATIISGNRSFVDGWTTFRTATFAVSGRGFIARDMAFQNTAGPEKHQAVALRSDSDLSVYYRCGIDGYQDSLYTHTMRQFYRECKISGTVDFIFGDATAAFQNCQLVARKGLPNQKNTITAQTYLGRPWKSYSRTVFMQSYLSEVLRPEGWLEWNGDFALDTLFYAEYQNSGAGAAVEKRVKWGGYRALNDSAQASNFTVSAFIEGNLWLPSTGVAYTAGLGV
ncbi:hypothetical protein K1719_046734 [Acacia pycnantha]|nr:hypothetical protein K1719_046734 [Acacia pycnantha]